MKGAEKKVMEKERVLSCSTEGLFVSAEKVLNFWGRRGGAGWSGRGVGGEDRVALTATPETEGILWEKNWLRVGDDDWTVDEGLPPSEASSGSWTEERGRAAWERLLLASEGATGTEAQDRARKI